MERRYDLIVIGAGPGGYVAAIRAAQLGLRTALCEQRDVGGTCLNRGCIPTKTLLHSANLYREMVESALLGVYADQVRYDLEKMYARKEEVVTQLRSGIETLLTRNRIDRISGSARIVAPETVHIGKDIFQSKRILIATGSMPVLPPIPGIEHALTSDDLLMNPPTSIDELVIIGGGVIGVEFASIFSALGKKVTVFEAMERILPPFDREISQNLSMILKKRGVRIITGAQVMSIEKISGGRKRCCLRTKSGEEFVDADLALCAVGRRANTKDLFGEGVSLTLHHGYIPTNDEFETKICGIFAIGDVTGGKLLAHAASAQGIAAVESMCGVPRSVNLEIIPSCVYTSPEIATVGLTADEAKERGFTVKTGKYLLTSSGKALIERSERSFVKLVFDERTDEALGAQLMCPRATDLIGEMADAVANHLTREQLASVIRPHPTFCEALTEAAEQADGISIHSAPNTLSAKK